MSFQCATLFFFVRHALSDVHTSIHDNRSRSEREDLEKGRLQATAKDNGFLHACYPYLSGRGLHASWKLFGCCMLMVRNPTPATDRRQKKCTHDHSGFDQRLFNIFHPGGNDGPEDLYVSRHCRFIAGLVCLSPRSQPTSFSSRTHSFFRPVAFSLYFGASTFRTTNP